MSEREAIIKDYCKEVNHLRELGFIELTPDRKGIVLTPQGRAYWIQSKRLANKDIRK